MHFLIFNFKMLIPLANAFFFCQGILLPAYASFKALESENISLHQKWIAYWLIWALLRTVELILSPLVGRSFPLLLAKAAFLGWLTQGDGSMVLYEGSVKPFLQANEASIDAAWASLKANTKQLLRMNKK